MRLPKYIAAVVLIFTLAGTASAAPKSDRGRDRGGVKEKIVTIFKRLFPILTISNGDGLISPIPAPAPPPPAP